jgi:hypothetical protein
MDGAHPASVVALEPFAGPVKEMYMSTGKVERISASQSFWPWLTITIA